MVAEGVFQTGAGWRPSPTASATGSRHAARAKKRRSTRPIPERRALPSGIGSRRRMFSTTAPREIRLARCLKLKTSGPGLFNDTRRSAPCHRSARVARCRRRRPAARPRQDGLHRRRDVPRHRRSIRARWAERKRPARLQLTTCKATTWPFEEGPGFQRRRPCA